MKQSKEDKVRDNNIKVIKLTEDEFNNLLQRCNAEVVNKTPSEPKEVMVKDDTPKDNAFTVLSQLINEDIYPMYNKDSMIKNMAPISPIYYENGTLLGCTNPFDPIIISYKAMIDEFCAHRSESIFPDEEYDIYRGACTALVSMYQAAFHASITSFLRTAILPKFRFENQNFITPELENAISCISARTGGYLRETISNWHTIDTDKNIVASPSDKNCAKYDVLYRIRNVIGGALSENLLTFARVISFSERTEVTEPNFFPKDAYIQELNKEDNNYTITPEMLYTLQSIEYTCVLNTAMIIIEMMLNQMKMSYEFLGVGRLILHPRDFKE